MCEVICVDDAVERIEDGAVVMIGGFMGSGTPPRLIDALVRQKKSDLTIISNDTAKPGIGIGKLIDAGLVRKVVTSHIGTNPITQKLMIAEELDVELVPQGTLAERIRAGGFGLGGVLTRTGVGTLAAEGETTLEVDGETYVLAKPLRADVALINAKLTDYLGNLTYSLTARNFNPLMAMAADKVFAEAEAIVPVGTLAPDVIATPHVLVDYLVSKEACHG
ncbi:CoA transferase subunit A [Afifella marina]|uniref:Acetate CoA/acetoacetate CoA-transferase alpha subunit n=1 Tax=Afifella marina DSM 2698 TaxID=1120955 RepID=A0A1G5MZF3_AFIMA|nr:3-oxoacid CoA-transferase subunit A [Afifella marina]MBK1622164.1 acetyl-CoA--acetoacetyl-CoA transferase subunit alpha [Afifella marina DSM 2698]MBK1628289.1 acetyl-CoA--acetoacetyl-CoA transferase subunit alpha [Afifella marina]MBK5918948.1 acetyl-CoA--acetoacetyl-CoA transferase subunit alpha [Afifella marina]RAI17806.1 acetyl-CoA--acetoacetyl-CoA transferase subunit alpha [Afifella marina DSM 2698]SCZ30038.1 acetate CoA/acetoacetate CoA-transferase alpha subunit [Afifella marina DSM 269